MYGLLALVELWQVFSWVARGKTPAFAVRRRFILITESFTQEELASVRAVIPDSVMAKIRRHQHRRRIVVWKLCDMAETDLQARAA
jgi:hypothetical protein